MIKHEVHALAIMRSPLRCSRRPPTRSFCSEGGTCGLPGPCATLFLRGDGARSRDNAPIMFRHDCNGGAVMAACSGLPDWRGFRKFGVRPGRSDGRGSTCASSSLFCPRFLQLMSSFSLGGENLLAGILRRPNDSCRRNHASCALANVDNPESFSLNRVHSIELRRRSSEPRSVAIRRRSRD
jgi:hypothetical protein